MPNTKSSSESKNPVLFAFLIGSFLGIFITLTAAIFLIIQYKSQNYLKVAKGIPTLTVEDRDEKTDQNLTEYFVSDIQPMYPQFSQMIGSNKVTEARSFNVGPEGKSFWIVQVNNDKTFDHYLVYKELQKKLDHPMTGFMGDDAKCALRDVRMIKGTDYGRTLADKMGYVVLAGDECQTYGGGEFVSVYELSTGKKVPLSADFTIPSTQNVQAIDQASNAHGMLRSVNGIERPVLVVDFGVASNANELERVTLTGIFDVQTGKLKQLIRY